MSDIQQVEATTIDAELGTLSRAEHWLADARGRVAALAAQYPAPAEIADERGYKDAKSNRASARKDAKQLDDERKAMTREMDDALKRFRSEVKDVLVPLTELDAAYKQALDEYEERWAQERLEELRATYEEYAPDLMPLVPMERLLALRGSERGKAWLARGTNIMAAKAALTAAIDQVASDEQTLAGSVDPEDLEAAKADLFTTLDLGAALRTARARAEQRERVRRLEEERRRREEEQRRIEAEMAERRRQQEEERRRLELERIERERESQDELAALIEDADPAVTARAIGGSVFVADRAPAFYEPPAIIEQPAPDPMRSHIAEAMGQPAPGQVPPYLMCCYGRQADADAFKAFCEGRGMKATVRPTGGRIHRIVAK